MQLAVEDIIIPDTEDSLLRSPVELAEIVARFTLSDGWLDRVRLRSDDRWYERLHHGADYDIWVISWMPGQSTGFHDHGESAGAFVVTTGVLEEHRPGEQPLHIYPGEPRAFGADYAHDVRNGSAAPAVSIHAYSPPLTEMNEYEFDGHHLVARAQPTERAAGLNERAGKPEPEAITRTGTVSIDQVLSTARRKLRRLTPQEAHEAVTASGAVLVDIRPEGQRANEGSIPGALIVERNVLEWRFDPTSTARLQIATSHDLTVIVFCSEGYTSSLAAVALQDLGLWRATDIVGGFQAWRRKQLPNVSPGTPCSSPEIDARPDAKPMG